MRPASTMKVITAVTALDQLGGSYEYRTSLSYKGVVENGVLLGDVYCVGGFDPLFGAEDMAAFVGSLRALGVDTIRGNIYADKSMKEGTTLGEGWCWDDDNPVLSPLLFEGKDMFMEQFLNQLQSAGIYVDAFLGNAREPVDAQRICTRRRSLDQVLLIMMKESDNLLAESVFYHIAASSGNRPATTKDGRSVVKRLINRLGLDPANYKIADGSGLSLYNYVTPELEVAMLRYASRKDEINVHLRPTLPVASVDGTLKQRMGGGSTRGNVCAKTGTVTGISSLAGYCTAGNGHRMCFSIINQGIITTKVGRDFQDKVCTILCETK
jgi:D-alanyl-D-alanine carboxypeptidase/D-alanyl-D-alanine-endopeptidase (penicillin-binding protein 4)